MLQPLNANATNVYATAANATNVYATTANANATIVYTTAANANAMVSVRPHALVHQKTRQGQEAIKDNQAALF